LSESWVQREGQRWVSLELQRDGARNYGTSIRLSELEAAGVRGESFSGRDVRFALRRDAGVLECEGAFDAGRGTGSFRFTPNGAFAAALQKTGRQPSSDDMLRLAIHDVSQDFIASIEQAGYKGVAIEDLVKMRIHGVDADYIAGLRKAGYDNLPVEDLIKTRIHGATPAYVMELRNAGYTNLSIDDVVKTRIHGATPAFAQEVKGAGLGSPSVDDLVKMRIHGVTPRVHPRDARARLQGSRHRRPCRHAHPRSIGELHQGTGVARLHQGEHRRSREDADSRRRRASSSATCRRPG
jgi:hypothetical protein